METGDSYEGRGVKVTTIMAETDLERRVENLTLLIPCKMRKKKRMT
jgi:hypothetical protein